MTEKTKNHVIITDDSNRTISHIQDRLERLQDEILRLKTLDYLLASSSTREIRELSWLVEPIAKNMAEIQDELMQFSSAKGLAITTKAESEKPTKPEADNA
jgi:hypothetical protein